MPLQCKNQIGFWKLDNMVMPLLNCYCSHYAFISHNEDHKLGKTIMCFTKACLLTVYVSLWVHGYLYFFKSSPLSFRYYLCDEENSDCTRTRIEEKGTWNQSNMWNFIDGVELPCTVMVYFGPVWVMEFHMRFHPIGNSKSLSDIVHKTFLLTSGICYNEMPIFLNFSHLEFQMLNRKVASWEL